MSLMGRAGGRATDAPRTSLSFVRGDPRLASTTEGQTLDVIQLLRVVQRRWYIAVPLAVVALAAAFVVRAGVQPGYTVAATVVVLPPSAERQLAGATGSLLDFNATTQAQALSLLASGAEFRQRVTDGSSLAAFSVGSQARDPFITISVEAKDQAVALGVAQRVISELQVELDQQAPSATGEERILLQTLAEPAVAAVDDSRFRAAVVALAVGLVAAVAITVLVDGAIAWRRRRAKVNVHSEATAGGRSAPGGVNQYGGSGSAGPDGLAVSARDR